MYRMEYLVQTSGAAEGKDPLERQEGRLVSGSLRLVSGLKKEGGRDAIGLVGETKQEATLTASTSTGRRGSRTTISVGEISKLLPRR